MKKGFTPLEIRHQRRLDVPPEAGLSLTGFTLFETLVVILIIAVLATLAIPQYNKTKERIYDNQASADLKLIQMAEKGYHIDTGSYYPAYTNTLAINNNLKLNLPIGSNPVWNYETTSVGCGQATRYPSADRSWCLAVGDAAGVPDSGTCGVNCP